MKRHGNLWSLIVSKSNIATALKKAALHKKSRKNVREALADSESTVNKVHKLLCTGAFKTSGYHNKYLYEPKLRIIYSLPFFPDRIIHHALLNIIEPIRDALMYSHSYSCRIGMGQHRASWKCLEYAKRFKYVAQLDISQFYVNIDHEILTQVYRQKIKDAQVLNLLDGIVNSLDVRTNNIKICKWMISCNIASDMAEHSLSKLVKASELAHQRPAGLAVGSLTSQWFGNLYLTGLDKFVVEYLRMKHCIRFCDDFLLFSDSKQQLHEAVEAIKEYLFTQRLLTFSKETVYPTDTGIDFCGYRHFSNGVVLVRKSTAKNKKREMRGLMHELKTGAINKLQAISKIASVEGWIKHADAHHLHESLRLDQLKKEVNDYAG